MGDSVENLAREKINKIYYYPLIHQASQFTVEGYQVGQAWLSLCNNLCWLLLITLSVRCPAMVSRKICSITFPGTELRLTSLSLPRSSFLPFLKTGVMFAFFQSSKISLDHHDLSKTMKNDLPVTPTSSLSTLGCIPSGPMDLCTSSLFKCSLTWSSSTEGKSSVFQTF